MKEEAIDSTVWGQRLRVHCGPVLRQTGLIVVIAMIMMMITIMTMMITIMTVMMMTVMIMIIIMTTK